MSLLEQPKRVLGLGVTGLGTRGVWGHILEFGVVLERVSFDELHLKWHTTSGCWMIGTKEWGYGGSNSSSFLNWRPTHLCGAKMLGSQLLLPLFHLPFCFHTIVYYHQMHMRPPQSNQQYGVIKYLRSQSTLLIFSFLFLFRQIFTIVVWNFELYMIPLALLLPLAWNYILIVSGKDTRQDVVSKPLLCSELFRLCPSFKQNFLHFFLSRHYNSFYTSHLLTMHIRLNCTQLPFI